MNKKKEKPIFDPHQNFNATKKRIGYKSRKKTAKAAYKEMGFMSGLEVHQQLKTDKKLFCNCPAGVYQKDGDYDAEVIRHMRPTLSELGEYDGTALMEFKTKKNITYRIANVTTCTYDVDDTPPFIMNSQALDIALEIGLLLKGNVVGELHITRKQYLDGSIPTGFQRTGIVSIEGSIPLKKKAVRIIQLSIEEDSCREVSDIGHERIYTTDRLGMPLIETVTYPDMKTPDEVAEAAQYIRFLNRSTGKVRTGIGAAREDVNVSITDGTRVEIKGVSHIRLIPELTHNEAFRQKSFLEISKDLNKRVKNPAKWKISHKVINGEVLAKIPENIRKEIGQEYQIFAVNLPSFQGVLSFFTQPGRMFAHEISDRLKVIACIEKPHMLHSEEPDAKALGIDFSFFKKLLGAKEGDAQIIFWGPGNDMKTGLETIAERCRLAFEGVPNETRKSLADGTTLFERVLPGPDRMYPDTDSAPISISQERIDKIAAGLPVDVDKRMAQLKKWNVPLDAFSFILKHNLVPLIEKIEKDFKEEPRFVATLLAHRLKNLFGSIKPAATFDFNRIYELFKFVNAKGLNREILFEMLPEAYEHPKMVLASVLSNVGFKKQSWEDISNLVELLNEKFPQINRSSNKDAGFKWMMKEVRKAGIGNFPMAEVADLVRKGETK